MGWTSYHATNYKKGKIDVKAEMDNYWEENNVTEKQYEVLKSAMVGATYYAAIRLVETDTIFAAIFRTSTNMKDYYDISYKPMDETYGPCYYDCPVGILKLLSPTENQYALEWREKCKKTIEQKKINKNTFALVDALPVGTELEIIFPRETTNYSKGQKVLVSKYSGRGFYAVDWRARLGFKKKQMQNYCILHNGEVIYTPSK